MACVYKHIRLDNNEVFYIGIGKTKKRPYSTNNRNKYWHNIVNKCRYSIEIINDNIEWDDACEEEKYWIKFYGRKDLNEGTLVNMTDGGDGIVNLIRSDEHIEKIRNASIKNKSIPPSRKGIPCNDDTKRKLREKNLGKKLSNETKLKISIASKNQTVESNEKRKNSLKGRIVTEETRKKLSIANKGKKPTELTKQKQIESVKGRKISEETKRKISEKLKGRVVSEETRLKLSIANKKK